MSRDQAVLAVFAQSYATDASARIASRSLPRARQPKRLVQCGLDFAGTASLAVEHKVEHKHAAFASPDEHLCA